MNSQIKNKARVEIPMEDFFRNPEKSSFNISPNGLLIAYMKPWEEGNRMMNIYVIQYGDRRLRLRLPLGAPL